uniref:Uncharacterized protein n=1 Tax=Candidatus Methanophaga sp. ANME-1 ERB7 TaxID=2759913 RepID=A0A7G9Z2R5_9EURY|nr:hypothetical protein KENJCFKB_00009 [Methanosarcinales archaeon ANME-1 ERB7]
MITLGEKSQIRTKPEFGSFLLKFLNQALAYFSKYLSLALFSSFFSMKSIPIPPFPMSTPATRSEQNLLSQFLAPCLSYLISEIPISDSIFASGFTNSLIFTSKTIGSSLFCMGNSISLLSAEADYMRGMLNVERP